MQCCSITPQHSSNTRFGHVLPEPYKLDWQTLAGLKKAESEDYADQPWGVLRVYRDASLQYGPASLPGTSPRKAEGPRAPSFIARQGRGTLTVQCNLSVSRKTLPAVMMRVCIEQEHVVEVTCICFHTCQSLPQNTRF